MRTLVSSVLALLAVTIIFPARGYACSCVGTMAGSQPCSTYWHAGAVFAGRVAEITVIPLELKVGGEVRTYSQCSVRFESVDAFRGIDADSVRDKTVTVITGMGGGDCGYEFVEGESYFVYANRADDGKLHASICSRTRPLSEAGDDLTYARDAVAGKTLPGVYGVIRASTRASLGEYVEDRPLVGVRVTIDGGGRTYETASDAEGRFHVHGLAQGAYRVRVTLPDGYRPVYGPIEQEVLVASEGCVGAGFGATTLAAVTGSMVDRDGKPAADIELSLVPADPRGVAGYDEGMAPQETTDEAGQYRFEQVPPGTYFIVVNPDGPPGHFAPPYPRTYYRGAPAAAQATPVVVVGGGELELATFRLPPSLIRTAITGVVLGRDGAPVAGAMLFMEPVEGRWDGHIESTDQNGGFRLEAFEGIRYRVRVEDRSGPNGARRGTLGYFEVTASTGAPPVRFVAE